MTYTLKFEVFPQGYTSYSNMLKQIQNFTR